MHRKRNKKYLAALALLAVTLVSCEIKTPPPTSSEAPPDVSQPAVSQPQEPLGPEELNETWDLLDADYIPVREDPLDDFGGMMPDYNGMDEDAFYDWANEQGFNSDVGPYPVWAENGVYDWIYLAYTSNKDCLSPTNKNGLSVFLLDTGTGEEQIPLSGSDRNAYYPVDWLSNDLLLCFRDGGETKREYCLCDWDGNVVWLDGAFESDQGPIGYNHLLFVEVVGQELRLVQADRDGTSAELARAPFDGTYVTDCAVTGDGSYVCYILQKDRMSFDRYIVIWNTATGQMTEIKPPQMAVGEDNMGAISVDIWYECAFQVEFSVSDVPDSNGHHELWRLRSDAWEVYGPVG